MSRAAEILSSVGVEVEVIDLRSINHWTPGPFVNQSVEPAA